MTTEPAKATMPPLQNLVRECVTALPLYLSALRPPVKVQVVGQGWPVLVIPGFTSTDMSTRYLRRSLDRAGFHAYGWKQGLNIGPRAGILPRLEQRINGIASVEGRPVVLLGWSLGGLFARSLAHRVPDDVVLVVTLGSPFSGDRRANRAWPLYELLNGHNVNETPPGYILAPKPPVQTIAVWSRKDGIVAPQSARGLPGEADRAIELDASHFDYGGTAHGVRQVVEMLAANLPQA